MDMAARAARPALLLLPLAMLGAGLPARAAPAAHPYGCAAPAHRQFDFWLGDWDATEPGSPARVARLRVESILDGCVVHEVYAGSDGHRGESFSLYVAARRTWRQTWVTNDGKLLDIEGGLHDGAMVLSGAERLAGGGEKLVRGSWKAVPGGVRETAATSTDGGKSWVPWFDLLFTPHER